MDSIYGRKLEKIMLMKISLLQHIYIYSKFCLFVFLFSSRGGLKLLAVYKGTWVNATKGNIGLVKYTLGFFMATGESWI